jgi:hypothetical protein
LRGREGGREKVRLVVMWHGNEIVWGSGRDVVSISVVEKRK